MAQYGDRAFPEARTAFGGSAFVGSPERLRRPKEPESGDDEAFRPSRLDGYSVTLVESASPFVLGRDVDGQSERPTVAGPLLDPVDQCRADPLPAVCFVDSEGLEIEVALGEGVVNPQQRAPERGDARHPPGTATRGPPKWLVRETQHQVCTDILNLPTVSWNEQPMRPVTGVAPLFRSPQRKPVLLRRCDLGERLSHWGHTREGFILLHRMRHASPDSAGPEGDRAAPSSIP